MMTRRELLRMVSAGGGIGALAPLSMVRAGFAGPAVADGRVFVLDWVITKRPFGTERALAFDEKSGKLLWAHEWEADYRGISWPNGPRATPTVDGDPDAKVVAFDKMTGAEIWRALKVDEDLGVAQPVIITAGGARQLIIWYPGAVASLNPETGAVLWQQPYKVGGSMTVALPQKQGSQLFLSTFYDGPLMLTLDDKKPAATVQWKGKSDSEIQTDGLHAVIATPVIM